MSTSGAMRTFEALEANRPSATGSERQDHFVIENMSESSGRFMLGVSAAGDFSVIIKAIPSSVPLAPIRLASLAVDFSLICSYTDGTETETHRACIVRCTSPEFTHRQIFAAMADVLRGHSQLGLTEKHLHGLIMDWAGVFVRLKKSADPDVVGVCGELLLISQSSLPDAWVAAWHTKANDLLDFEFPDTDASVEVKASTGRARKHSFSYEQLLGQMRPNQFVASVLINFSPEGESVGDVVRALLDRLEIEEHRLKVWHQLSLTCGASLDEVLARRIDITSAISQTQFYASATLPLPGISDPLPAGVSRIRFSIDLAVATSTSQEVVEQLLIAR